MWVGIGALIRWEKTLPPPRVQEVSGTVERRLHLTLDTPWDSDKRRKFVCREEP